MTNEPIRQNTNLQDLKDPILITTFASELKGGQTAPSAIAYALGQWDARLATEFEAEDCYIDSRMRPWVRRDGDKTVLDWPQNIVYRVEGEERSFLILVGVEPSLNWRGFVARIGEFAKEHQVGLAVNLKSVPATVPHTLQAPVKAIYSDEAMAEQFGIESLQDQEGPADIGRVLNLYLAEHGVPTIDVYAMEPFYAAAIPDAEAGLSLLHTMEDVFGLEVDTERMEQVALTKRQAIDAAVAGSEQLSEAVAGMEQRANNQRLLAAPEAPAQELDATEVLDDAEAFLRSLRNEPPDQGTEEAS
jgi:predicted ATP-grasp superfamily ATP-dependent carboligase